MFLEELPKKMRFKKPIWLFLVINTITDLLEGRL